MLFMPRLAVGRPNDGRCRDHRVWRVATHPEDGGARCDALAIVAVNALVTAWTQTEVVWLIAVCGVAVLVLREVPRLGRTTAVSLAIPSWLLTGIQGEAPSRTIVTIAG
jgi:hypothetical protein